MTRRVLCALLAGASVQTFLCFGSAPSDTQSGQWMADFLSDGQVQLHLRLSVQGGHHESSFPVSPESFQGLNRQATHFEFVRDAGAFICDGRFQGDHGAGTFVFVPDVKFVAEMRSLGYTIEPGRLMDMAVFDISRAFVRDLDNMGYHSLLLDDLVRFRIHGVTSSYIRDFQNAGYTSLGADELVNMRIHGVGIEYIRALESFGYHRVPVDDLIRMQIHGVSADFIRDLKTEGYSGIPVEELIRMQIHGVTPEMVKKVRAAGFTHPTTDQLVEMRIHGVLD